MLHLNFIQTLCASKQILNINVAKIQNNQCLTTSVTENL